MPPATLFKHATCCAWLLALLVACSGEPASDAERDAQAADPVAARWATITEHADGFLVWESKRSGRWRIWTRDLDGSGLRQLSPEEEGRDHFAPHIAPDGRHLVYMAVNADTHLYSRWSPKLHSQLRLHRIADGDERLLVEGARSYMEDRIVTWLDAQTFAYIARDGSLRRLDIESGDDDALYPVGRDEFGVLPDPTLRYATQGFPDFAPFDAEAGTLGSRRREPGCQPYFSRDGRHGFWVARPGGPIRRIDLETGERLDLVARSDPRLSGDFSYVYFPMVSPGQRLLAFGASRGQHDHFRFDYEIFVAPIDPSTLALVGDPVRYTFDEATDRFPDVFEGSGALGRHRGEAPFSVSLRSPAAGDEPWSWDFGDGARAEGPTGAHTYGGPGTYRVLAERGDVTWRGEVQVEPRRAPRARSVRIGPGPDEVQVDFDEPIALRDPKAVFDLAGPAAEVTVEPNAHTLRVRAARPIAEQERLDLEGVTDRAGVPNLAAPMTFMVEPRQWPGRGDQLVLVYRTARDPNLLTLPDGTEQGHEAVAFGRARLDHAWRLDVSGGHFEIRTWKQLVKRIQRANAFSIEATFEADELQSEKSAAILALSGSGGVTNVALLEHDGALAVRLRTSETPDAGRDVELGPLPSTGSHHILITYRPGLLRVYLDGALIREEPFEGSLANWTPGLRLAVGAVSGPSHAWRGVVEGIAIYARFVEPEEAPRHAELYAEVIEARDAVDKVRVRARRRAQSAAPTPEEIAPYREALVVHEWKVEEVLSGELGDDVIRVAHYAVLDARAQDISEARDREVRELLLERFADNPQAQQLVLGDDLEIDPDVALFLDVGR